MFRFSMGVFAAARAAMWFSGSMPVFGVTAAVEAVAWFGWFVFGIYDRRQSIRADVKATGAEVVFISITGVVRVAGRMPIEARRRIEDRHDVVIVEKVYAQ